MCWCFAIVNNKLAEIFFDENKNGQVKIRNHCYVRREDYKTKTEQKYIEKDISKVRVVYRSKKYKLVKSKILHN